MPARKRKCPTPQKVEYPTRGAALAALRSMPLTRTEVRPYKCRKHWHLTSKVGR